MKLLLQLISQQNNIDMDMDVVPKYDLTAHHYLDISRTPQRKRYKRKYGSVHSIFMIVYLKQIFHLLCE